MKNTADEARSILAELKKVLKEAIMTLKETKTENETA